MELNRTLKIDKDSIVYLINFIMTNLKEDREVALRHQNTLSSFLDGQASERSEIEMTLLMKDVSEALERFLQSSTASIDQAIKITKIVADLYSKAEDEDVLTDNDRVGLADLIKEMQQEKEEITGEG